MTSTASTAVFRSLRGSLVVYAVLLGALYLAFGDAMVVAGVGLGLLIAEVTGRIAEHPATDGRRVRSLAMIGWGTLALGWGVYEAAKGALTNVLIALVLVAGATAVLVNEHHPDEFELF